MFFWMRSSEDDEYGGDFTTDEDHRNYDSSDFGEEVDENLLVYLKGDPDQIAYAFKDVLNGAEIIFADEVAPSPVLPFSSESTIDRYGSKGDLDFSLPPQLAEKALLLILSKSERETLIGDLAEEWYEIEAGHGRRFANIWYWEQTVLSVWPLLRKALRWSLAVWLGELIRRQIC